MYEPAEGRETAFQSSHRQPCLEAKLVLDAVGVPSKIVHAERSWFLTVDLANLERAEAELREYHDEKVAQQQQVEPPVVLYGGATWGVVFYVSMLILIGFLDAPWGYGYDLRPIGRMHAESVVAGQWWRGVTALTLHVDVAHLASNIAFGSLFGFMAGRLLGGGVAWLGIVVAGTVGNIINGYVQEPDHSSIGASTAVFAALGILVAHALRDITDRDRLLRRWKPLIGGVVLLAFTGVGGERTDVVAHVTGFLAGLITGWASSRLPKSWLANSTVQSIAATLAMTIVLIAWTIAIATH